MLSLILIITIVKIYLKPNTLKYLHTFLIIIFFTLLYHFFSLQQAQAQTPTPGQCCVTRQKIDAFEAGDKSINLKYFQRSEYKKDCHYATGFQCDLNDDGVYKGHDINHNIVSRNYEDSLVSCLICSHNNNSTQSPVLQISFAYWGPFYDQCIHRHSSTYNSSSNGGINVDSVYVPCFELPQSPQLTPAPTTTPSSANCSQCDLDHNNIFTDDDLALMYRCIPANSHCTKIDVNRDGQAQSNDIYAARICQGDPNAFPGCKDIDFNNDNNISDIEYNMLKRCIDEKSNSCVNHNPNGDNWFDRKDIDYCKKLCNKTEITPFPTPSDAIYALSIRTLLNNTDKYEGKKVKILGKTNFEARPCPIEMEAVKCENRSSQYCDECSDHKIIMLTNPMGVNSSDDILDLRVYITGGYPPIAVNLNQNSCGLLEKDKPIIMEGLLTSRYTWRPSGYADNNQIIEGRLQKNDYDQWYLDLSDRTYIYPYNSRKQYPRDAYGTFAYCEKPTPTPTRTPTKPPIPTRPSTKCITPSQPEDFADLNGDGKVNLQDIEHLRANLKNINLENIDLNHDGIYDKNDLGLWGKLYRDHKSKSIPWLKPRAGKVSLTILPQKINLSDQETTRIWVHMTGYPYAIDTQLQFDPNFIQVLSVNPGNAMPKTIINKIENNSIFFSASTTPDKCDMHPGVLFSADIKALKPGKTELRFNTKNTIAAREGINIIGKLNNAYINIKPEKNGITDQLSPLLQQIKPKLLGTSNPLFADVIFQTPKWLYDGIYAIGFAYLDKDNKLVPTEGRMVLAGKTKGEWQIGFTNEDNYCRWLAYSPLDEASLAKWGLESCPLALKYRSPCNFTLSYPYAFKAKKFFATDKQNQCAYLSAPDYKLNLDSRAGFYMHITRTPLGTVINNITINSLDDFLKAEEQYTSPPTPITVRQNKQYGSHSGIEFVRSGYDPGKSFIFILDNQILEINWPDSYQGLYSIFLDEIISSITK